jgi:hypothetical protein
MVLLTPLLLAASLSPSFPPPPPLVFAHSWDTLPVFWFSANETGPETTAEQALIANYSVAVLSWELQTQGVDPWRRTDVKMRALAAELATTAPSTEVLMYMQGQLAMDWYEITRAMLPPPCGTDSNGVFADFWLLDNATHRPAPWPSPKGSVCRNLNGSDLSYDFGQAKVRNHFVQHIVLPFADAPNVKGVFLDDADSLPCGSDLCDSFNGLHYWPCGAAARERLFNGTVAWTKDVTVHLNARGQIPIFNSNNDPNASTTPPGAPPRYGESNCPRSATAVHAEFGPDLVYGRFQEAWNARCADIWNAREQAEWGIPLFIHGGAKGIDRYTVAAFLMAAGNQSFMANSHGWTDGGTAWQPAYYEQPLGRPLGRSVQDGNGWRRQFEHVNVSLDCWKREANFSGWILPPLYK